MAQASSDECYSCSDVGNPTFAYSENLQLLTVDSSGTTQYQSLNSFSTADGTEPFNAPGNVIPDGRGGVLASWVANTSGYSGTYPLTVADIGPSGTAQANFSNISMADGQAALLNSNLVLGEDNDVAFVTNGLNVDAFVPTTVSQVWSYASSGGTLSLDSINGNGLNINDSSLGLIP